ncbi:ATP binding protein, putative [Talaromyces stipitatus ATCC 10500]|uniref:GPN-loop GTPase 3 n=1 Tax=Talaromyces stipitatus (strain ATCC 10500 / CBS 375.48 / QM 6759 / NRRL 1006) TaxID=441959 RepID=B8LW78_TALSN|nr:ATP binding protein, putative [Talaromyces stipitatus ATCC 10500]EED24106.1 ATP binding protein, putative [Talaromyces stipitatus ATCC 10500]
MAQFLAVGPRLVLRFQQSSQWERENRAYITPAGGGGWQYLKYSKMSKFGVLVMGPAGAGKTTFCNAIIQHLQNTRRSCFYVNLDPAAETFQYDPDLDIRELITLEDVMEELELGPNGGLIYCFEFLMQNLDFLTEALEPLSEEYLIIFDMPGQIELYTHIPLLPTLTNFLSRQGPLNISLCAAYLLESTFVIDKAKFFAGTLSAMSAMILLEMPHINILSKMDQVKDMVGRRRLKRFVNVDVQLLDEDDDGKAAKEDDKEEREHGLDLQADPSSKDALMSGGSFNRLNRAVGQLIDDFSMVSFLQLDVSDEDSVGAILSYIDDAIQYHEAQEPREPNDAQEVDWEDADD